MFEQYFEKFLVPISSCHNCDNIFHFLFIKGTEAKYSYQMFCLIVTNSTLFVHLCKLIVQNEFKFLIYEDIVIFNWLVFIDWLFITYLINQEQQKITKY